jgi:exodeoxyribonuclease V alpha subunit
VLGPGPELPAGGPTLLVRFGERDVPYPAKSLDQLGLAYAVTVHKAQGSEYPAVVVPLHGQHHLLLQRNLLYTALTRGRRFVVLIGPPSALARATRNDSPIRRFTMLGMALRALAGDE